MHLSAYTVYGEACRQHGGLTMSMIADAYIEPTVVLRPRNGAHYASNRIPETVQQRRLTILAIPVLHSDLCHRACGEATGYRFWLACHLCN